MATVQISFTDASDNEDEFIVYRGDNTGANPGTTAAEEVATITWNSVTSTWDVTSGALDASSTAALNGTIPGDPSTAGQAFVLRYTESNTGSYKYGVVAKNNIGPSAITISGSAITV
jgi:hypothetical protein